METAVNMQVVGSEMDHVEALRDLLESLLGETPALTARIEIRLGSELTVVTVNDDQITVQEQPSGRLFQGDWQLARAALAGFVPPEPPPTG